MNKIVFLVIAPHPDPTAAPTRAPTLSIQQFAEGADKGG